MAKHPVTRAVKMLTRNYLGASPVNKTINSVAERAVKGAKRGLRVATSTPERLAAASGLVKRAKSEHKASTTAEKKFKLARQRPSSEEARRKAKLENVGEAQKRGKQAIKDRERNKLLGQARPPAQGGGQNGQPYASRDERWLRSQQNYR